MTDDEQGPPTDTETLNPNSEGGVGESPQNPPPIEIHRLPIALAGVAALLSVIALLGLRGAELGVWLWPIVGAGVMAVAAAATSWRRLSQAEVDLQREQAGLDAIRSALEAEMGTLEGRRQKFERRLLTYAEWMEFPDEDASLEPATLKDEEVDPEAVRNIREQDEQVARRIREFSEEILVKFRGDDFRKDDEFEPRLLIGEIADFVEGIARIYQPDAEDPLLETNVEKLLQAVNRLSLQLLFQIEQLPLNLKDYSLSKAAEHIRTASKFYGYYKSLSPYMPIANYTLQLGRLAAGTNPVSAGTWFLGSEALRRGGKKVGKHYYERYSLKLTQDAVRIVGNEAASVFDDAYRYRDAAWIYGVEITELVHRFAPSIETLQQALREVGGLSLRSSYDRVFLYRCLAAHASPDPDRFSSRDYLTAGQRHEIARKLERFFDLFTHGRQPNRIESWVDGVESRIGVRLKVSATEREIPPADRARSMVDSLAGFLVEVKEVEFEDVGRLLSSLDSWEHATSLGAVVDADSTEWPPLFDYPDIAPDSPMLGVFFKDLVTLEKQSGKVDPQAFAAIGESARFLKAPADHVENALSAIYATYQSDELQDGCGESAFPHELAVPFSLLLSPESRPDFAYPAQLALPDEVLKAEGLTEHRAWVVGAEGALWCLVRADQPKPKSKSKKPSPKEAAPEDRPRGAGAIAGSLITGILGKLTESVAAAESNSDRPATRLVWVGRPASPDDQSAAPDVAQIQHSLDRRTAGLTGGIWQIPVAEDAAGISIVTPHGTAPETYLRGIESLLATDKKS